MSLHVESLARVRERCPVLDCRALASEPVEIELPDDWEAGERYTTLPLLVNACPEHAPELLRRAGALLEARADLHILLAIIEAAVAAEQDLRSRANVAAALRGFETDRAERAERALELVELDLRPHRLQDLVPAATAATGVDLTAVLRSLLDSELASGTSAEVALTHVRELAGSMLAPTGGEWP